MGQKRVQIIWCVSLFIVGISAIVLNGANIIGIELPNILKICMVVIDLIALPIVVFTTVKRLKGKC